MPKAPENKPTATCGRCNRKIRIPEGWSPGAATRKHYWAKHRDVMQPEAEAADSPDKHAGGRRAGDRGRSAAGRGRKGSGR
ncbi:MAG: hypothetical protein ABR575_00125 [Actinomycetota bacterium]